ncbi:MAG: tRNA (adenosine(37)-N6)-dimethylallyltransferase MiaA [Armatimonadetes bacterium]|nr:MAG: tRNA (adenosine(37)-N6)-dimethylallyltransferase MiaA [Armatimonadota bacterium]
MKKLLVILGPTATGKTDLALRLASLAQGQDPLFPQCELISCDSRQVYKGLDIGTGKLPGGKAIVKKGDGFWEINSIKVWMYDVVDPKVRYTVKDYMEQAQKVITDIHRRGKLPIIVGGTGLYLKALLEGLPNLAVPIDLKLRGELEKLSLLQLQEKLRVLSPARWKNLNESDRKNPRRLLRSIELVHMYPYARISQISKLKSRNYNILKVGLTAPRQVLKERIFSRLLTRLDQGMIKEAEILHKEGLSFERMKELGLEYGMLAKILEGAVSREEFITQLSTQILRYSKRQMTWFKNPSVNSGQTNWFDITEPNITLRIENLVSTWYDSANDQKD